MAVEGSSIDEAFLEVDGAAGLEEHVRRLRATVLQWTRIRCPPGSRPPGCGEDRQPPGQEGSAVGRHARVGRRCRHTEALSRLTLTDMWGITRHLSVQTRTFLLIGVTTTATALVSCEE